MDAYSNERIDETLDFMEATATRAEIERFSLRRGDVVLTKDSETPDDIGIAAVVSADVEKLVCGYHLALIRPDTDELDSVFLAKQLSTHRIARYFAALASGSTRYGLPVSAIELAQIPVPEKNEQSKISEVLETVDLAIERVETLIAKQQRIKTGLMQDLFTRGIDHNGNLRSETKYDFRNTQVGRVPLEWDVEPIENRLAAIIDYRGRTPRKTDDGIPLITARNVRNGFLSDEPKEFISIEDYPRWMTRGIPRTGDVLFTTEAPIGNVARVPEYPIALAQRILTLQANRKVLSSDFLFWLLHWEETIERLKSLVSGSTVTGIKQSVFRKVPFAFPSVHEQMRTYWYVSARLNGLPNVCAKKGKFFRQAGIFFRQPTMMM